MLSREYLCTYNRVRGGINCTALLRAGMPLGRAVLRSSVSARVCLDGWAQAPPHLIRWAATGGVLDGSPHAQGGLGSVASINDGSTSESSIQAGHDVMPTSPDSGVAGYPSSRGKDGLGVKSVHHPRRIEFYHRRHRDIKKFEKKQDRIHNLREIAREKEESGRHNVAQAAAAEADRLEMPWLSRNVPVKPPSYASVSQGQATPAKQAVYSRLTESTTMDLDLKQETRKLDVLNLKVGYAVDAQYALPDEVKAFILDQTTFCLYGVDKNQVTQIAANIRRIRPPEPYKGAGIRIVGETIKLKDRKVK